jgi:hypothetical protein
MPDHLRPVTVAIRVTWTAEQALTVWEMRDEPGEKIRIRYSAQLQDLLAEEQRCGASTTVTRFHLISISIGATWSWRSTSKRDKPCRATSSRGARRPGFLRRSS